eukprot:5915590-Prymnesium_polylepis.2
MRAQVDDLLQQRLQAKSYGSPSAASRTKRALRGGVPSRAEQPPPPLANPELARSGPASRGPHHAPVFHLVADERDRIR